MAATSAATAAATAMLRRYSPYIDQAAAATRTMIYADVDATLSIASYIRTSLLIPKTSTSSSSSSPLRCLVLASTSATKARRAGIVPHYLRKAGFLPLLCELPESAPIAQNVAAAVDAAKRTGAEFVVAYGSTGVLAVGRAAACVMTNTTLTSNSGSGTHTKVRDLVPALGGKASPTIASLPFLAIPSCPSSGTELRRDAPILLDGVGLGYVKPFTTSLQACILDPRLATTLDPETTLRTGYATLIHAIEAYVRTDSDATTRKLSWLALNLAARHLPRAVRASQEASASPAAQSFATNQDSGGLEARTGLGIASLFTSAAMAQGPLGPARGIALSIASKYRIPYTAAITALGPEVISSIGSFLAEAVEEEKEDEGVGEEEGAGGEQENKGSEMKWRGNLDEDEDAIMRRRKAWNPKTPFMQRPTSSVSSSTVSRRGKGKLTSTSNGGQSTAEEDEIDDKALEAQLLAYAKESEKELLQQEQGQVGRSRGRGYKGDDDENQSSFSMSSGSSSENLSDSQVALRRLQHVSIAIETALKIAAQSADVATSSSSSSEDLSIVPSKSQCRTIDVSTLGSSLTALRKAVSETGSAGRSSPTQMQTTTTTSTITFPLPPLPSPPSLRDYALSDADMRTIASIAEVDDDTLACIAQLKGSDIFDMLKRS